MLQPIWRQRTYRWANGALTLGQRTLIMGILNVTPDSFSDGGRYNRVDAALRHAKEMLEAGADIIDIGGESTRPGHQPVGQEEELERVLPVIEALRRELPQAPISVDTYKAEVARQALEAGAHIMNDIWGCKKEPEMAHVAARYGCPLILMHNRPERRYDRFVEEVKADLLESVELAKSAGVKDDQIWLDPGIGFAKTGEDNLVLMSHLDELCALGYPVLLGTSRKKFIRDTLQLPVDDVVEGTAATVALGIAQGCQIVRVHDVASIARTARMCDAVLYR
ncbi:dihydropteroate synthase [Paenibacillus thiaminolyticus]|uniref:Dihydropteroate synthase n=1 Tax=Paenibacillus thiaminolyticus TaxID=49283 RepID=A0AAP9DVN7_PANTH|nr:dihydropteroate synthase [Paenibacillus thiaminolyticus]MCY9538338.1 dihydropteroate synthase [Paenibacillus thiaminolyticus]MCY9604075.1 dihydropteroate synthase [Paenibacillus thiaminolyticus]MCY9610250.1 dihydropteroate synthase [Paenibacillus thiaminolyticus]MCY9615356.1 dihydropteroate synthase [Paenibacillus thiaminolyticus]MCY9620100.1 dihydropteroate synthase [Paenibacillus thiaminolyticus]